MKLCGGRLYVMGPTTRPHAPVVALNQGCSSQKCKLGSWDIYIYIIYYPILYYTILYYTILYIYIYVKSEVNRTSPSILQDIKLQVSGTSLPTPRPPPPQTLHSLQTPGHNTHCGAATHVLAREGFERPGFRVNAA